MKGAKIMNYLFIKNSPYEIHFENGKLDEYRLKKSETDITDTVRNEVVDKIIITLIHMTYNMTCEEQHVSLWTDEYTKNMKANYPHLSGLLTDYKFIKLVEALDFDDEYLKRLDKEAEKIQENPDYMGGYFSRAYHKNKMTEFTALHYEYQHSDMKEGTLYELFNKLLK